MCVRAAFTSAPVLSMLSELVVVLFLPILFMYQSLKSEIDLVGVVLGVVVLLFRVV